MHLPAAFHFQLMTEAAACAICAWRYEPPYDFYNQNPAQLEDSIYGSFLNPAYHYYSVLDENEALVAFSCFGEDARVPGGDYRANALDVGGGLRPDLTGHGVGLPFMRAVLDFATAEFSPALFRATVAEFNLRAQRACKQAGYVLAQRFVSTHNGLPFVILIRPA